MRIKALCKRVAHTAQETEDTAMLLLEVSWFGMRSWLHKNIYSQDYQTPEMAKHSFPLENSVVKVTILTRTVCLTFQIISLKKKVINIANNSCQVFFFLINE